MNSPLRLLTLLVLSLLALAPARAAKQLYTCGMHPQVIRDEPGDCPICGMKLQPIRANTAAPAGRGAGERRIKYYQSSMAPGEVSPKPAKDSMGMDMVPVYEDSESAGAAIQIDAATVQRMNLRTAVTTAGPVHREFRTVGSIAFSEDGLRDITTKYEGWIEQLFVNTTWAQVKAGDPLFEIYSPDLYNAQLNYLVAVQSEPTGDGLLVRAALARLQLFDIPEEFLAELKQSKQARRTFVYRSPAAGTVIEKMGVTGQMMKPGERIYRLADLSTVWVEAEIYEHDLAFVKPGDEAEVRVTYGPDRILAGKVAVLLPKVQEQTRTATARIVLPNADGYLRPGMFVDVHFASQIAADAVLVPEMAILRSGERNTVFVALDDGSFEPREVTLGERSSGDLYQVLSGLRAGERVVTSGQFMLDSESQLREAIQKMIKPAAAGQPAAPTAVQPPPASASEGGGALVELARVAADAAAPLAADDLSGHQNQLPTLNAALKSYLAGDPPAAHGPLAAFGAGIAPASDIKSARKAFAPLSTAITNLVVELGVGPAAGLHAFDCPMAKARWLQREPGTRNPFYGARMSTCGDEIPPAGGQPAPAAPDGASTPDAGTSAMALPPGHPPVDAVTLASFRRSQTGSAAAQSVATGSGDACGSCGMSATAMAAGEPCEHDHK